MAARKPALTLDEERFVDEYLIDRNGSAAYRRVHPGTRSSTACEQASRLLKKKKVAAAVQKGIAALRRRTKVSAERVIRELSRLAFFDIGEAYDLSSDDWVPLSPRAMPYDTRRAIVGVKIRRRRLASKATGEDGKPLDEIYEVESVEYKFADKLAALDKLMRHLGLYKDLPPLELLLACLPPEVATPVRTALAFAVAGQANGSPQTADGPTAEAIPIGGEVDSFLK